jgi:hypothetical protein
LINQATPSTLPDSQSRELTSFKVGNSAFDLFEQFNTNDADIVNMSVEDTSDDCRSQGTITPIQRSHRQSPVDHNRGASYLNMPFEGSFNPESQDPNHSRTPEKRDSMDAKTISGIKREAELDSKSFLRIK